MESCSRVLIAGYFSYALALFYFVLKDDLAPLNPVPKFLVVKAVVFFTFWQAVGLSVLSQSGLFGTGKKKDEIIAGLQDFLVCIEMFCASIAHHWAFSYKGDPMFCAVTCGSV